MSYDIYFKIDTAGCDVAMRSVAEAPNGWGTVEGCKRFFQKIINEYDELPPELKDVSTFWIE